MADDKIVISAIARVVDLASPALKAIQSAIAGVSEVAEKTGTAVGSLGVKVGGAMKGFAGRIGEAAGKVGGFVRNIGGMMGPLGGLIGLAGLGGAAAAMREFVNKGDALYKMSQRLQQSVETIQLFRLAADNVGLADDALSNLQKTMAKVAKGGKEAEPIVALLRKMGVTAAEIAKGDLSVILPKIMEGFAQNENQVLKTNAALVLFGKSGQAQLEWLSKGAKAVDEARKKMAKFGYVTTEGAKAANEAADMMGGLGLAITGVRDVVGNALIPAFLPMIGWLTDLVAANRELLKQVALPAFIGALTTAVISLGIAVAAALGPWTLLAGAVAAAGVAIYQNWDSVIKWLDTELPGLTTTVGNAAKAIGGFAADTIRNINEGFKTGGFAGGIAAYVAAFKTAWSGIGTWLIDVVSSIDWSAVGTAGGNLLGQAIMGALRLQVTLGQYLVQQFSAAAEGLKTINWGDVGRAAGTLFVEAWKMQLRAMFDVGLWAVQMTVQLGQAIAGIDWLKAMQSFSLFFVQLQLDMVRIGKDLIVGLIAGMIDAIPGLRAVTDQISSMFSSSMSWLKNAGSALATAAGESLARLNPTPGLGLSPAGAPPNLLAQPGVAAPQKIESNTNITVNAPPGSSVTSNTTTKGATDVNVGTNTMATVP
jgi:hypothetical protein